MSGLRPDPPSHPERVPGVSGSLSPASDERESEENGNGGVAGREDGGAMRVENPPETWLYAPVNR